MPANLCGSDRPPLQRVSRCSIRRTRCSRMEPILNSAFAGTRLLTVCRPGPTHKLNRAGRGKQGPTDPKPPTGERVDNDAAHGVQSRLMRVMATPASARFRNLGTVRRGSRAACGGAGSGKSTSCWL